MPKRKKGERSEAQVIADKHNGNCFCLEGIIANLTRILDDCIDIMDDKPYVDMLADLDFVKERMRGYIEKQYEYEKDKAGKPAPAVSAVGK